MAPVEGGDVGDGPLVAGAEVDEPEDGVELPVVEDPPGPGGASLVELDAPPEGGPTWSSSVLRVHPPTSTHPISTTTIAVSQGVGSHPSNTWKD